jgi:hypothetical protein
MNPELKDKRVIAPQSGNYHEMEPDKKARWIEALRGGEYAQDRDALKTNKGYCCLGVYCDISKTGRWEYNSSFDIGVKFRYIVGLKSSMSFLPYPLSQDVDHEAVDMLIQLNDRGKSFGEIADWIEENL